MRWQGVHGASSYVVERAEDAPLLTWATGLVTTKCRGEVNTMTSGTKYWFRVAAIGAAGQGPVEQRDGEVRDVNRVRSAECGVLRFGRDPLSAFALDLDSQLLTFNS